MWISLLTCIVILYLLYELTRNPSWRNMPPGPKGLPFLGNLLDLLFEEPIKYYAKIANKYGPISSIRFGSKRVVLLSSADLLKKAFVKQGNVFSERPDGIMLSYIARGKGIVMSTESTNFHARRVLMNSFKRFGYGKRDIEGVIDIELDSYMKTLKNREMKRYNPRYDLAVTSLNVTWNMLSGDRFDPNDPRLKWFVDTIGMSFELIKQGGFICYTYIIQFVAIFLRPKGFLVGLSLLLRFNLYKKSIKNHKSSIESLEREEDFMYKFLDEQKRFQNKNEMNHVFSDSQLLWILSDVFIASMETTVTTIRWALTIAVQYPEIQENIQKEIDSVIGINSKPSIEDREKMPYMEAFISEVLRAYPAIPVLMHATCKDTTLEGYSIPKGTWVIVNIWAIQMDKKVWGDPENFRPSRFLDSAGNYVKSEHLIPFSVGRRNCIGEPLALAELFLFLVNIFKNYRICRFDETVPWKTSIKYGLSLTPHDLDFKFVPREYLPNNS